LKIPQPSQRTRKAGPPAQLAAQIRQEADKLPMEDPGVRDELLETAEGFEIQAQDLRNALRERREDIH
jgi:hypothetical protein